MMIHLLLNTNNYYKHFSRIKTNKSISQLLMQTKLIFIALNNLIMFNKIVYKAKKKKLKNLKEPKIIL